MTHSTDSMPESVLLRLPREQRPNSRDSLAIDLLVRDREVIDALLEHRDEEDRERFALDALRIGVVALRHASGRLDAEMLRRETTQLLTTLGEKLEHHAQSSHERLNSSLKEYFDPQNGRFNERIARLVAKDGELVNLLGEQLDGENSRLARTLVRHVGGESPLMKLLDPQQSEGLLATLRQVVEGQLQKQSQQVLREFSLDNTDGALARLVRELTARHGDLSKDLHQKIDEVVKEFSLDQENSALSRLVQNVDRAQRTISLEFSLDNEGSAFSRLTRILETTQGAIHQNLTLDDENSPLARLKRELLELMGQIEKKNLDFQERVLVTLTEMAATKRETQRSTRHGEEFETAVFEFLAREAQQAGDLAIPTGTTTGRIKNCKVGDCVIELGPDSPAPGEKIVVEAKQHGGYHVGNARAELEQARKNRDATWGIFVFSRRLAPTGLEPLQRVGNDILCCWDSEDSTTDVYLKASLILARALSIRQSRNTAAEQADFEAIDRAILDIEKRAANLAEIKNSAETIHRTSQKIIDRTRIDEEALHKQLEILREKLTSVREALGGEL